MKGIGFFDGMRARSDTHTQPPTWFAARDVKRFFVYAVVSVLRPGIKPPKTSLITTVPFPGFDSKGVDMVFTRTAQTKVRHYCETRLAQKWFGYLVSTLGGRISGG